jgi:predicted bacteriocin transport accessory protein
MTLFLLILIAVMTLVTMVCSIIVTIMEVKDKKAQDLVKKALGITSIVLLVALVIGASVGVSHMDKTKSDNKTTTTESSSDSSQTALEQAGFNKVSIDEYLNLIKSSDKQIILIARPTCGYCEKFTPILKQAMEDMNLTINYVNTDNFSSDDWSKFQNSFDYLASNEWGTPLTLIVQNGKIVDKNNGYVELDAIKEFFTKNGLGK